MYYLGYFKEHRLDHYEKLLENIANNKEKKITLEKIKKILMNVDIKNPHR